MKQRELYEVVHTIEFLAAVTMCEIVFKGVAAISTECVAILKKRLVQSEFGR